MDIRFEQLDSLHWLWAVAVVALLVAFGLHRRRRALERFADASLLGRLVTGGAGVARLVVRATLGLAALVLLVAAMLDPRWGVTYQQVQQRGIDVVVVLDVSRSMLAEDVRPNRLGRAQQYVRDLVEQLGGDRVGLVTFAGAATVRCPLTVDYGAFLLSLDLVEPESAARGGSLLGDALRLAVDAFTDEVDDHKAIIVLSDGEDHGSYPLEAAQKIRETRNIPIYTIGIGDAEEGARIPIEVDGRRVYLTHENQEVWSRMNPTLLRDVALASGGAYIPVGTGTMDVARVYQERIEPVAKRTFETTSRRRYTPRYQWFAGAALALLLAQSLVAERPAPPRPGSDTEVPT